MTSSAAGLPLAFHPKRQSYSGVGDDDDPSTACSQSSGALAEEPEVQRVISEDADVPARRVLSAPDSISSGAASPATAAAVRRHRTKNRLAELLGAAAVVPTSSATAPASSGGRMCGVLSTEPIPSQDMAKVPARKALSGPAPSDPAAARSFRAKGRVARLLEQDAEGPRHARPDYTPALMSWPRLQRTSATFGRYPLGGSTGPCLSSAPVPAGPAYGGGTDLALSGSAFSVSLRFYLSSSARLVIYGVLRSSTSLDFAECQGIGDPGVQGLARALPAGLERLRFSARGCAGISDKSVVALARGLPSGLTALTVQLKETGVSPEKVKMCSDLQAMREHAASSKSCCALQ
ncbi:unnamed protein product [Prorocentrum cordatum]|nr:unnamed protein product [Polarella glacialis]